MSSDKPKYDFAKELGLGPNDELDGYKLTLDGEQYDLRGVEAAYQAADAKGLVAGTLAAFPDGSLAVVVGRNTQVRRNMVSAEPYPVAVALLDEYLDYGVEALTSVQCPVKVEAKTLSREVSGMLTAVVVSDRGRASVVINDETFALLDLFALELA